MKIGDKVVYNGKFTTFTGEVGEITEIDFEHNNVRLFFGGVKVEKNYLWTTFRSIEPVKEEITKPSHYHQGGIDVIGFSLQNYTKEQIKGFYRINIMKYIHRYDFKNGKEDLIKAKDYLDRLIDLEGEENE